MVIMFNIFMFFYLQYNLVNAEQPSNNTFISISNQKTLKRNKSTNKKNIYISRFVEAEGIIKEMQINDNKDKYYSLVTTTSLIRIDTDDDKLLKKLKDMINKKVFVAGFLKKNLFLSLIRLYEVKEGLKWYKYEPEIVELRGALEEADEYGPPNYGENPETDTKVKYHVIKLEKPINVMPNSKNKFDSETVVNIERIQIATSEYQRVKQLINKKILIKGTLFHSITSHHYTDVLIWVKDIKEIKKEK
ncbi:MAG: DUF4431 domain-containing protein [Elusimicrobiota bacterium]